MDAKQQDLIVKIIAIVLGLVILYFIAQYLIKRLTQPPSVETITDEINRWSVDYAKELEEFASQSPDGILTQAQRDVLAKKEDILHTYITALQNADMNWDKTITNILIGLGVVAVSIAIVRASPQITKILLEHYHSRVSIKFNKPKILTEEFRPKRAPIKLSLAKLRSYYTRFLPKIKMPKIRLPKFKLW
jgi:hypothetical protein